MKWIGQHIYDFIARYRNDVYLEAIETGTIASGGNLGLDSNNKIVKADTESGELSFNGSTADGVLTFGNTTTIDVEPYMTFSGTTNTSNTLKFGATNASTVVNIITDNNNSNIPGDRMFFAVGRSGDGTNVDPGVMSFSSGVGTGNKPGGNYLWYGTNTANPTGGASRPRVRLMGQLFTELVSAVTATNFRLYSVDASSPTDYFNAQVLPTGQTKITTASGTSGSPADIIVSADGAITLSSTDSSNDIKLLSAGNVELNADGGDVDFKDNTAHFAKLEQVNGRGSLDLYGGSTGGREATGQVNFYEDTGFGTNHITLKPDDSLALGSDKVVSLPNANGTLVINTKVLVTHAIAYFANTSSDYVIPLAGTSHSDNTNLSLYIVQYFSNFAAPYDGQFKKMMFCTTSTAARNIDVKFYKNGQIITQTGTTANYTTSGSKFGSISPTDWTFTAGERLGIVIDPQSGNQGGHVTATIVFEFDTTT